MKKLPKGEKIEATGHALIQVILIFVTQVDWQFQILMMIVISQKSSEKC